MIESRVAQHEHNMIPLDCCVQYDLDDVVEALNKNIPADHSRVLDNANKFINTCDCVTVIKRLITWLRRTKVVDLL